MKLRLPSVIMPLILINIAAFMLEMFLGNSFINSFMLISEDIFSRPWILFTSMFLHADVNHIFFNMYGLFMFGPLLEQRIGPERFLLLYIGSGLVAAVLASFFYPAALGASGAIMGMLGVLIIFMPNLRLLFFFFIPMPLWVAGIVWAIIDTLGIFVPNGVANIAHLAGMATGLLFGLYLKSINRQYKKKFSAKTHLDDSDIDEFLRSGRI